ncbi:MAG: DNA polymerase III subunit delta' [Candidatus Omnitrophica bacterium]|nr:DNA polymerase III subunit delta' [Candidatus Omnitrophota bacterium]MBU4303205.1 DNA polymerase III subunit delta' [Candidatus Omnitrophota bacterium]MBU4418928.1 DNA polymerase III subunit delta' [Candidatus Omnitrophota bacterium]MBU4468253.1 DNA polymerase III subunit delta' [Candidatus Omnitrophota bacterium]MCG2708689.1 DNA polymerase III subunit delta' [Candidatus Omnitrophota bacterium]
MRFSDCLGHDRPLTIIKAHLENNRFSGSYIFSGPEGIGKRMVAKIAAQELNCTGQTDKPCGLCDSCRKIEKSEHPDLHIIEHGEAQIKIEDIRGILRQASFRPYEGRVKVFIIDNAHALNSEAANSLLKVLEEPPKDVLIILITHKPQNIIKTVLSRCKLIKFCPLIRARLETVLIKNYALDKATAHFLAFYAEGRLGLALRLKDTPLLKEKNKIFDSFILSGKPLDRDLMGQNKEQLRVSLNILASWFRDIYLLKCGASGQEAIHLDRHSDLLKLIPRFSFKQLDEIMATLSESSLYLERNINSKLILHNLGAQLWKA